MTTELTKAAQQALEQLEFLNACYPHKTAADAIAALQSALTQRPAAQAGEVDRGPRVLREVFALCEDTMTKIGSESADFSRGRAFEAKGISRAIGTWFQDEFCGRSHMGEPSLPAPQHATPVQDAGALHMFEFWWEAHMPQATQSQAWAAWMAAQGSNGATIEAAQQATPEPVGEVVAWQRRDRNIVTGEWSEWHEDDDIEEELDPEWAERRPLFTRPAPGVPEVLIQQVMEALRDGLSVCMSVAVSRDRKIRRDGCTLYAQSEEWCRWLDAEVGPKIRAALDALAAAQAKGDQS